MNILIGIAIISIVLILYIRRDIGLPSFIFKPTRDDNGWTHAPPRYWAYGGGFWELTLCPDCKLLGLYEDMIPYSPCYRCGGKNRKSATGKWDYKTRVWVLKDKIDGYTGRPFFEKEEK